MKASLKIKKEIILQVYMSLIDCLKTLNKQERELIESIGQGVKDSDIEDMYDRLNELDLASECEAEFRCSGIETKIPREYSRHYESKSVARQLSDDSYVGWTYWYGGGKHGEPETIEWIEDSYNLEVTETEQTIIVREFVKIKECKDG